MPPAPIIRLDCPAKVNLALSVGPPLPNGYHPLASWMVALDFADALELTALGPAEATAFDIAFAADAPVASVVDWPLAKDLGHRAHALLEAHVGRRLPVRAKLRKRIPAGAGLGGGSGNAAGILVGLDRLMGLNLDADTLKGLAQRLGSDVVFLVDAMLGRPSALVTGLGEKLEAAPRPEPIHLTLFFPGFGCPTGEVYKTFDQGLLKRPGGEPKTDAVRSLIGQSPLPHDAPFNDLAEPACVVRPRLGQLRATLAAELGQSVHVTGSGSTLFALAADAAHARGMAQKATAKTGLAALAARTLV